MELAQFKKETEVYKTKNPSATLILLGEIKENFELVKCLEYDATNADADNPPICLKEEKISFKKGEPIEGIQWFFNTDDGSGNPLTDGEVTVPYKNGNTVIPFSKINIKGYKPVSVEEKNNTKNDLTTTYAKSFSDEKIVSKSFLQKNKNYLLIALALVAGYFAYKKFKK
jgi:hypothetical protein